MKGKAMWGILGGFLFFSGAADTIYQLINWDSDYREGWRWALKFAKNIAISIVGISLVMEWRKNRDGELMTDAEEKQVYQEWQDKKEDNSIS